MLAGAFLFGSQVTGNTHAESDIDIALLFTREEHDIDAVLVDISSDLSRALQVPERRIDVSSLLELPLPLRFKIFQKGKKLLSKDEEVVRDELLRTAALYHDEQLFIQAANERFAESLRS